MVVQLRGTGRPFGLTQRTLARVTFEQVDRTERPNCFLAITRDSILSDEGDFSGYAAVLVEAGAEHRLPDGAPCPVVSDYDSLAFIGQDAIIAVHPQNGQTFVLYRPDSPNNAIFATGRCNSNCLMCSQPPVVNQDDDIIDQHLRLIELIREPPASFGITGGEPTLLGNGLIRVLTKIKERFPDTDIQMLTNGRFYAYDDFVAKIAEIGNSRFVSAIPLYSDVAKEHDYIVQAEGAFDETVIGLYNAAKYGLRVEIRVVLHKQTLPRLRQLAEYIYRNAPFVEHIALMGLENMGYVKKNWELLWIDPLDYSQTLEETVRYFFHRRMNVSIYNLQLCVLPRSLWAFARRSISDYKNIYLDDCARCDVREECGGLFASSKKRHSRGIKAIGLDSPFPTFETEVSCSLDTDMTETGHSIPML